MLLSEGKYEPGVQVNEKRNRILGIGEELYPCVKSMDQQL